MQTPMSLSCASKHTANCILLETNLLPTNPHMPLCIAQGAITRLPLQCAWPLLWHEISSTSWERKATNLFIYICTFMQIHVRNHMSAYAWTLHLYHHINKNKNNNTLEFGWKCVFAMLVFLPQLSNILLLLAFSFDTLARQCWVLPYRIPPDSAVQLSSNSICN